MEGRGGTRRIVRLFCCCLLVRKRKKKILFLLFFFFCSLKNQNSCQKAKTNMLTAISTQIRRANDTSRDFDFFSNTISDDLFHRFIEDKLETKDVVSLSETNKMNNRMTLDSRFPVLSLKNLISKYTSTNSVNNLIQIMSEYTNVGNVEKHKDKLKHLIDYAKKIVLKLDSLKENVVTEMNNSKSRHYLNVRVWTTAKFSTTIHVVNKNPDNRGYSFPDYNPYKILYAILLLIAVESGALNALAILTKKGSENVLLKQNSDFEQDQHSLISFSSGFGESRMNMTFMDMIEKNL